MADHAFPLNIKQICGFAWAIVFMSERKEQFKESRPFEKWWRWFKKRHSEKIALLKPDNLEKGSTRMVNEVVVKRDFDNLK